MSTPTITLHPRQPNPPPSSNPFPPLLHTPFGLALLELQGTINFPAPSSPSPDNNSDNDDDDDPSRPQIPANQIGHLIFPEYNPDALDPSSTAWMKRVYMYVGEHQRLMGEVKKLPKPLAVVRGRRKEEGAMEDEGVEELEVVDLVRYKIVFAQRPEPVTEGS
ncbi:chromosome transmission fidelity protein 8 [Podospora aff. communis PSN243]|uniref:Chromosome transmission fidelity protein 8 n=1 Tax=Podospora aff. communis PSN243 TaxID=3040156 RepID=A0AAV9H7C2_9PEZI|nr:chromosome transmission fidelity protein 8 [Podospora aff. communis PSN243]